MVDLAVETSKSPEENFAERLVSPETVALLDRLNPQLPETFRNQARQAAGFIALLDDCQDIEELKSSGAVTFIRQLGNAPFALSKSLSSFFPAWLGGEFLLKNNIVSPAGEELTNKELKESEEMFASLAREQEYRPDPKHPHRLKIREANNNIPQTRHFKCYLERRCLYDSLKNDHLRKAIEEMKKQVFILFRLN